LLGLGRGRLLLLLCLVELLDLLLRLGNLLLRLHHLLRLHLSLRRLEHLGNSRQVVGGDGVETKLR
jgi:hypothetical protein